jgi:hypothetical protein
LGKRVSKRDITEERVSGEKVQERKKWWEDLN